MAESSIKDGKAITGTQKVLCIKIVYAFKLITGVVC